MSGQLQTTHKNIRKKNKQNHNFIRFFTHPKMLDRYFPRVCSLFLSVTCHFRFWFVCVRFFPFISFFLFLSCNFRFSRLIFRFVAFLSSVANHCLFRFSLDQFSLVHFFFGHSSSRAQAFSIIISSFAVWRCWFFCTHKTKHEKKKQLFSLSAHSCRMFRRWLEMLTIWFRRKTSKRFRKVNRDWRIYEKTSTTRYTAKFPK